MKLSDLYELFTVPPSRGKAVAEIRVEGIALHSSRVRPGWVFVALKGSRADGNAYIDEALKRGAIAVVSEFPPLRSQADKTAFIQVEDARYALAVMAAAFYGKPSGGLDVTGITGTNGKTTVAGMLKAILRADGRKPGLIGTIAYEVGQRMISASRTTPDALMIQSLLREMVDAGCRSAVLEVSSHALEQKRVACVDWRAGCFTNLTQDHLDYHGTMEKYFEAKASLIRLLPRSSVAVLNADDAYVQRLQHQGVACEVVDYALDRSAMVGGRLLETSLKGSTFALESPWGHHEGSIRLPGKHNVSNALAAFSLACAQGVAPESALRALEQMAPIPGRLALVSGDADFQVFVDYAHTDDALKHVLQALKAETHGRVIVVFGCGGNRDMAKRPLMGAAASEGADILVVTSDNPRGEDPRQIIDAVLQGVDSEKETHVLVDRREAIVRAIALARAGDTVLVAGKGHETYQQIKGRMLPFDDAEVVREVLSGSKFMRNEEPTHV